MSERAQNAIDMFMLAVMNFTDLTQGEMLEAADALEKRDKKVAAAMGNIREVRAPTLALVGLLRWILNGEAPAATTSAMEQRNAS